MAAGMVKHGKRHAACVLLLMALWYHPAFSRERNLPVIPYPAEVPVEGLPRLPAAYLGVGDKVWRRHYCGAVSPGHVYEASRGVPHLQGTECRGMGRDTGRRHCSGGMP